jgi:hypothetical protein
MKKGALSTESRSSKALPTKNNKHNNLTQEAFY